MSAALDRDFIRGCLPHGPGMCLLEAVLDWSRIHVRCRGRGARDNPLAGDGGLHALHAVEYAAQASAVHGALRGGEAARPGVIASVRALEWTYPRLVGEAVEVCCTEVLSQAGAVVYDFELSDDTGPAVRGRVTIAFPEDS